MNKAPFFIKKYLLVQLFLAFALFFGQSNLERSLPEDEGVSTEQILKFLKAANNDKTTEFQSFVLLRHGKVISQATWKPYQNSLKNTLYSCSKSFTATAIGFAVQEGKLKVSDQVISFFPDKLPANISENLQNLTVKDLLTMSAGMDPDPSFSIVPTETDWVKAFLATPIVNKPGTKFLYNSVATYMLSAIIQKVTGEELIAYLKPRLFDPLHIVGMDWEKDPAGIDSGGWGLRIKTEDMAKFAQLFLQKGKWDGQQILDEKWIMEASKAQIMQNPEATMEMKSGSDWLQGYGYQMWRSRHDSYRGDGAFGQLMLVLPKEDAVIAVTAETKDMQAEMNLIWKYLLPAFHQKTLPENKEAYQNLRALEENLVLKPLVSKTFPKIKKKFKLEENPLHFTEICFKTKGKKLLVEFIKDSQKYGYQFTSGQWHLGDTNMKMPALTALALGDTSHLYPAKTATSFEWKDQNNFELKIRFLESPHSQIYKINFKENTVAITAENSLDFGTKNTIIKGTETK